MGLDITAYSNLQVAGDEAYEGGELIYDGNFVELYDNDAFPGRIAPQQGGQAYMYDDCVGFRAGSYGGYNAWRNDLAKLAGYKAQPYDPYDRNDVKVMRYDAGAWEATSGPFWELITFSDCEGTIGTDACKKLAKDFADFQAAAEATSDEWFLSRYNDWRAAFDLASNNGAVDFH
jgi:hypothetical protein